jgi:hypothetical protein
MGLFDSLLSILMPPVGLIHIDYNQKIVNETIEWADELYSRCGENVEDAFVYIELRENRLVRRFVYIQEEQAFCIEFPEVVDINSLENEVLLSEEFKELKKTGHIIIKKYN